MEPRTNAIAWKFCMSRNCVTMRDSKSVGRLCGSRWRTAEACWSWRACANSRLCNQERIQRKERPSSRLPVPSGTRLGNQEHRTRFLSRFRTVVPPCLVLPRLWFSTNHVSAQSYVEVLSDSAPAVSFRWHNISSCFCLTGHLEFLLQKLFIPPEFSDAL